MRRRPSPFSPQGLQHTGLFSTVVILVIAAAAAASAQTPYPGLANGFEVDGNLYSNNPGGVVGLGSDWLDGPPGPGAGVFYGTGVPKDPLTTWHFVDFIKSADQDVFGQSTKVADDPNGYEWKAGSAPQKDDIQNGFVHLTRDAGGDHWMVLGGDRRAITGSSYIDFEFLQNPLIMESDGSFTSDGPDSGRTVGDLLLTIELTKGGTQAQFFAQRWAPDGAGDFTYVDIPFPTGAAFVAANIDSQVTSTFPVFDLGYYGVNQFGEAAVNLNALLPNFGECFAIATVFVRTKSSASASAELKDFIRPFQLNQCLDETPPDVTCPADVTISCDQSTDPASLGFAFGTDNCGVDPEVSYADSIVPGPCNNEYTILRTWKATDQCGNSAECVQTITLIDDKGPAITAQPGPITVQCPANVPAPDISTIRATDDCGNVTVRHLSDVSDGQTCPERITRTYRVDDGCGHTVDVVQIITIDDDTPPSIAAPRAVSVECTDEIPPADIRLVTASDNCGSVTVTHVGDVSNGRACPEVITRTYRATDACGTSATATQVITIDDNTPPEVTGPANLTVECAGEIPAADTKLVTARDNCSAVTVSFVSDLASRSACPTQITRTYRAVDQCGNAADYVQVITVDDKTAPLVSGPDDIEIECRSEIPAADTKLITATDNCGSVIVAHVGDVSDGKKCGETIRRTYRATDVCGHATDWVQLIKVVDRTSPRIACPGEITVECAADVPPANAGSIAASDNCGSVTVAHVGDYSDGRSCPETISRVFRATDACGLTSECTQKIVVRDQTPPEITGGPGPVNVQCRDEIPAPAPGLVKARDNCGLVNVVHIGDMSDGKACPEKVTRTYRAYDECDNYRDFLQVFTVDDDIPPQITSCSTEELVECPSSIFFPPPTATDNCDPDPRLNIVFEDSVLGSEPWTFTALRTWVASDQCGNTSAACKQAVTYKCEGRGLCTHTQGFYGNYGGQFNGMTTLELIQAALSSLPLVVGMEGRATLTIPYSSAECVIERLPAGTTPAILPYNGNSTLWAATCLPKPKPIPLNSDGRFENVLLGQTITLGLNMRLNSPLFLLPLSETFCTQDALPGPDGLYGTGDDLLDSDAPVGHYAIPRSVLNAIAQLDLWPTVKGLWDLANRALAGANTAGATISEINDAVDAINRGFDGCRFVVDCPTGKDALPDVWAGPESAGGASSVAANANLPKWFELGQNHPNPFNPSTRITVAVPEAVRWNLAVYNVAGQLVRRFEGSTGGAEYITVEWDGRDSRGQPLATGVYLYRVQAGTFTDVKKMILLK